MTHTAPRDSKMAHYCEKIIDMKPMERLTFHKGLLELEISPLENMTPTQRILSNISNNQPYSTYIDLDGNYVICRHSS